MTYKLIDEDVSVKDLEYMVRECNSYDGSLEDYCYEINDEDFFNVHFTEPMEAVRAAYFGEYKYSDDYVRFNAYGNLKSGFHVGFRTRVERWYRWNHWKIHWNARG